jgi:hypothetical protein
MFDLIEAYTLMKQKGMIQDFTWKMNSKEGVIDLYITPVKTIEYITFTVSTKTKINYSEITRQVIGR